MTEFNARDGSWVQTLSTDTSFGSLFSGSWVHDLLRGSYEFASPAAIAVGKGRIWVGNDTSVTLVKAG